MILKFSVVNIFLRVFLIQLLFTTFLNCQSTIKSPLIEYNICPYEYGCNFSEWVATVKIPVYACEGDTINIAFWINATDSLIFNYGNMHIEQVGIAIIYREVERYSLNDTIYILSYTGEGFYNIWYKDQVLNVECFWDEDPHENDSFYFAKLKIPQQMTWWVNLSNKKDEIGWIPIVNICPTRGACFESPFEYEQK